MEIGPNDALGAPRSLDVIKPARFARNHPVFAGLQLGDLIVPDVSWNYQAGKIINGKLRPELVQIPLPPLSRTTLQQLANDGTSRRLRDGLFQSDLIGRKILMPPMVSGSQVVADADAVVEITSQSRKIGALDMEVAAVFAAAHDFFNGGGIYFAAKTVVDLADTAKDDRYHEYGCALSARFACEALSRLL